MPTEYRKVILTLLNRHKQCLHSFDYEDWFKKGAVYLIFHREFKWFYIGSTDNDVATRNSVRMSMLSSAAISNRNLKVRSNFGIP